MEGRRFGSEADLLSILIGINDLNSGFSARQYEAVDAPPGPDGRRAAQGWPAVLRAVRPAAGHFKDAETWDGVKAELQKRQAIVERLAAKYQPPWSISKRF